MDKNNLHEMVTRLGSRDMLPVSEYFQFLLGKTFGDQTKYLRELMESSDQEEPYVGDGDPDRYGPFDPWEVDTAEGEKHLHLLVDMLSDEDVRPAGRWLEYCLDDHFVLTRKEEQGRPVSVLAIQQRLYPDSPECCPVCGLLGEPHDKPGRCIAALRAALMDAVAAALAVEE